MSNRKDIYYWKCDRPSAFHSLQNNDAEKKNNIKIEEALKGLLKDHFANNTFQLVSNGGQGNHLTYRAVNNGSTFFIRIENGPEKDNYMLAEGRIIEEVKKTGVPVVHIIYSDSSRETVDFAYQIMEFLPYQDLNSLYKNKQLNIIPIAFEIGKNIAKWQSFCPPGFGPFNTEVLKKEGKLIGFHENYVDYYFLNLSRHLDFLVEKNFLLKKEATSLLEIIERKKKYFHLQQGCLVHKDLALWNILGDADSIKAIIDWDDTISGDPTDDLSLLACFYDNDVIESAIDGYKSVKELPDHFYQRFHLHLLRNMIVKAVIRVGANYFKKKDDFFLIDSGSEGASLEQITRDKIFHAYQMLNTKTEKIIV